MFELLTSNNQYFFKMLPLFFCYATAEIFKSLEFEIKAGEAVNISLDIPDITGINNFSNLIIKYPNMWENRLKLVPKFVKNYTQGEILAPYNLLTDNVALITEDFSKGVQLPNEKLLTSMLYSQSEGQLKWKYKTGNSIYRNSPTIGVDGTIYVGSYDNHLYAINPNGKLEWRYKTDGQIYSSPAINNNTIYFGSADNYLYAIYLNSTLRWKYLTNNIVWSPAIANDGTIYFGSSDQYLYAINPDGVLKWKYLTSGEVQSFPAIANDGTIYIGSTDNYLYAVNPDSVLKWQYLTGGGVRSSPAIADGIVYVGSNDNYLYAINANGTLKWKYLTNNIILSSPAIAVDGTIYVGSQDYYLYAINPDGTLKWQYSAQNLIFSSPAISNDGIIYVGSFDSYLYAIDPNGFLKWKYQTGDVIERCSPAISSDGTIYIGSWDSNLYAITTKNFYEKSPWPRFHQNNLNIGQQPLNNQLQLFDIRYLNVFSELLDISGTLFIDFEQANNQTITVYIKMRVTKTPTLTVIPTQTATQTQTKSKEFYKRCSIKNPISDQIIDFNSQYSYTIRSNEVFNGDIALIYPTETGSTALPDWLSSTRGTFLIPTDEGGDWGVAVQGGVAYLAAWGSLQIIDITDSRNPMTLSNVASKGNPIEVAVQGGVAYLAAYYGGLQIIDIADPRNPATLSYVATDVEALGVAVQGGVAYVAMDYNGYYNGYGGLQIINITDPRNPTTLSNVATDGQPNEVAVQGSVAYLAAGYSGLQIINITDPINPKTLSSVTTTGTAYGVALQGGVAYVAADSSGLQIINITDPRNPTTLSYVATTGTALGVAVQGNVAYVAGSSGLQIINLQESLISLRPTSYIKYGDSSNLTVTAVDYSGNTCTSNFKITVDQLPILNNNIDNQRIFPQQAISIAFAINTLFTGRGYLKPSIENKPPWLNLSLTPKLISTYQYSGSSINDIATNGTLAYLASNAGLLIIDISNPYSTFLTNSYLNSIPATKIKTKGNTVFLATNTQLLIIDATSAPATLVQSYNYPDIAAITYASNTLLISNKKSLLITPIDSILSYVATTGTSNEVAVQGGVAYVAAGNDGYGSLQIIDITDPKNPATLSHVDTQAYDGVAVQGDVAYLAAYYGGLKIIDILDPRNPATLSYVDTYGWNYGVALQGSVAYVAVNYDGYSALQIINITDPRNPTTLSNVAHPWNPARGVAVQGGVAYLAIYSGLQIINITDPRNPTTLSDVATDGEAYGVAVQGGGDYVAAANHYDGDGSLQIIDIADPMKPATLSYALTAGAAHGVAVQGGVAYLAAGYSGLQIINITDPRNPTTLSNVATDGEANGVAVQGGEAYVAVGYNRYSGLQIIQLPSITNINSNYIAMYNVSIGLLAADEGIKVIRLQDINIYVLSTYPIPFVKKIEIIDELVFTVDSIEMRVINFNNLVNNNAVIYLGAYKASSTINDIAVSVSLNQAFIATNNGLEIVDIASISNPLLIGFYQTQTPALAVNIAGTTVFLATGKSGLQILDCGSTWTLAGTPAISDVGNYNLALTVTDVIGAKSSGNFSILIMGSPILTKNVSNQIAYVNKLLDFSVSPNTFNDLNNNTLTYSATMATYSDTMLLPVWLTFDASKLRFYGTPSLNDAYFYIEKVLNINLTAMNPGPVGTSVIFNINVRGIEKPPQIVRNISNQVAYTAKLFDFTLPSNIFNDSYTLSYSAVLANSAGNLPEWLTFGASQLRFYGTPSLNDAYFYIDKVLNINLTAMNPGPVGTSVIFNINVRGIESPPQIMSNISNQIAYTGKLFEFTLPNNTFMDSFPLSYSAGLANNSDASQMSSPFRLSSNTVSLQLPVWLSFDSSSIRFYGTPGMGDLNFFGDQNLKINITAMNSGPIGSSVIYNLTVTGMPYGVMVGIIAGSIMAAGIVGFAVYRKVPIIIHAWNKITKTTKCWQFDERPMANKERKQSVYLMSDEYFDGQEPEYIVQHHAPGIVYNQHGIVTNIILNKDSSPLTITLKENEQELLPRTVIKNHSKPKKETLKVGNPVLNLIAAKGEYYHSQEYQLILAPPDSQDFKKVLECYQHHPASGYDIKSVEIIYNPVMELAFAENLKMLQARNNNPAFMPRFLQEEGESEEERELRIKTNELWKEMAARYIDSNCPDVKLLPLWHGTNPEVLSSIFKAGYANLATTDSGYFGKGLYSAYEAEYAYKYYYEGALILNWVSSYSAYPVIAGDMQKLTAKGTYQNYDTNFIPVVEYTRDNKDNFVPSDLEDTSYVYLPCGVGQKPLYAEIVVFERAQCLPRYLVTLQPSLVRSVRPAEPEGERIKKLLIRQQEILLHTAPEEASSTTNVSFINKQEVESTHKRSILVPNTPNDSPNDSFVHNVNKTRSKPLDNAFSRDCFSIDRKSIFLDDNPGNLFASNPLPEPTRLSAEEAYSESSSSSHLIIGSARRNDNALAMDRPRTSDETSLNMGLDETQDIPPMPLLLFSRLQQPAVYPQSQSSNIVAGLSPSSGTPKTTQLARMSI